MQIPLPGFKPCLLSSYNLIASDLGRVNSQLRSGLVLPEAVNVAIFTNHNRGFVDAEFGFGRFTGLEELHALAVAGDYFDPFDKMLFFHGVWHAANLDFDALGSLFDYRNMLLDRRISGFFFHQFHFHATAYQCRGAGVNHFNYIATDFAFENIVKLGQNAVLQ